VLIVTAAVQDYRAGTRAYRDLAAALPLAAGRSRATGGRVKLTLLIGLAGCTAGPGLTVASGPGPARIAGLLLLATGAALLVAGEVTRHRLVKLISADASGGRAAGAQTAECSSVTGAPSPPVR
jgi:hypothetical protein